MSQSLCNKTKLNPHQEKIKNELKKFYVLGLPLLKMMIVLTIVGLLVIGLYEYY